MDTLFAQATQGLAPNPAKWARDKKTPRALRPGASPRPALRSGPLLPVLQHQAARRDRDRRVCFHVFAQKIRVKGVRALNRLALAQHRIVIAALGQILRQNNEVAFLRVQNCPSLAFFVPSIFFSTQGISPIVGQVAAVFPVQLPNVMSAIGKASQFRIGHADEQHKVHMAVRRIQARIKAVRPQASTACAFAPELKSCWMQSALGCRAAQGPMAAMVTWPGLARTVSMMQLTACWSTGAKTGFVLVRSEERRVGKECRSRWSPYH